MQIKTSRDVDNSFNVMIFGSIEKNYVTSCIRTQKQEIWGKGHKKFEKDCSEEATPTSQISRTTHEMQ